MRLSTAIALGKATATLSRRLHRGGGTTMPGRVARAVEPRLLPLLSRRLRYGSVIVAGTNGKTTTARLLAHIMREAGHHPVHNRAGANLAAGILSALLEDVDLRGRPAGLVAFGIEDERHALPAIEHTAEARYCYRCGTPYQYALTYFGHMGRYRCPTCGVGRPPLDVAAQDVALEGPEGAAFVLD